MDGHDQAHDTLISSQETLQHLRLAAGLDIPTLARKACLSITQIQQLECGQSGAFYSDSIRTQASRRVMAILQAVSSQH